MSRNLKRLLLVVALSTAVIAATLFFTVDERTLRALRDLRLAFIALFGTLWFAALTFDALSIMLFARGTEEKIGFFAAMKTTTIRIFFNIVTPFGFGGQPFSIISLRREGIPAGKGTSIVVMKLITLSASVQLGALLSFLLYYRRIQTIPLLNTIFLVVGSVGILFIAVLVLGFRNPRIVIRILTGVGRLLHSVRVVKNIERLKRGIIHEAVLARRSFRRYFSHHLSLFITAVLMNSLNYVSQLVLLWAIFVGLGVEVPFLDALALGAMLFYLILFMPTPGAIGFGEAIFFLLYAGIMPTYLLGIALVLWRFFYHYLSAVIGAVSSSSYVSRLLLRKNTSKRNGHHSPQGE